jgi:hypothetical protein
VSGDSATRDVTSVLYIKHEKKIEMLVAIVRVGTTEDVTSVLYINVI